MRIRLTNDGPLPRWDARQTQHAPRRCNICGRSNASAASTTILSLDPSESYRQTGLGSAAPTSNQPAKLGDWPTDVAALADHLDVDRFAVIGTSSGGPYALAAAALRPRDV